MYNYHNNRNRNGRNNQGGYNNNNNNHNRNHRHRTSPLNLFLRTIFGLFLCLGFFSLWYGIFNATAVFIILGCVPVIFGIIVAILALIGQVLF